MGGIHYGRFARRVLEPFAARRDGRRLAVGAGLTRPKVAVFATNFGAPSQTFVYEELRHHVRYEAEVFAWRRRHADRFPFEPVHSANALYAVTGLSPAFFDRFRETDFALVHAHFGTGAVYALPYADAFDLPLVVTFHGYDVPLLTSRRRFLPEYWPYALTARTLLERMTLGLCVSSELRDLLLAYGVPSSKLRVFRLGIDLSDFRPSEKPTDSFRVAMVGRFVEKKGFEYGLRAFARFLESGRRGTLVVVGEGELGSRLHELATSLGIDEHVEWRGWIPPMEVASVLARTHVLMAPSVVGQDGDREGCPMVVQEACASGVVVVASRHGGLPDAVAHGETGFLAPEHDDAAIARYLGTLYDDADLRERMAAAGLAKMHRERDVDERVESLEAHYDEARAAFRGERSSVPDLGTRHVTRQ